LELVLKVRDVRPEILGVTFGVFIIVLFTFLMRASELLLKNPEFEEYVLRIISGEYELELFFTKLAFFVALTFIVNFCVYKLISFPKRMLLGKGSMMFFLGYTLKTKKLSLYLKSVFVRLFRPFLTGDKSNQSSLFLFINFSLFLLFFESGDYFKSISYSVIAAVIFQYFIFILPQEKKKSIEASKLMSSCRTIRARELILYESLGYNEPILLSLMTKTQQEELNQKISLALTSSSAIGNIKSCHKNYIEPFNGGFEQVQIPANWSFKELLDFLNRQDLGSLKVIEKNDISMFDGMQAALDSVNYQLYSYNHFNKQSPDEHAKLYCRYLRSRQSFLLTYHKTAMNYIHEHDESYLLPLL
jgi:hypothetical protein